MFVVDTNILVDAANEDSPFHSVCRHRMDAWRASPDVWFVTWGILYEFLRVTTHPRVMPHPWTTPDAWGFLEGLLASRGLQVLGPTERHADVAAEVFRELPHLAGNILHDARTAILMREHGIRRICTRDNDFHRFPFLDVIDPTGLAVHEPAVPAGSRARRTKRRA